MNMEDPVHVHIESDIVEIIDDLGRSPEEFLREALVLAALDQGRMSAAEACDLLGLSRAELEGLLRSRTADDLWGSA